MKIYKLKVDSPVVDDNIFEDYYVSKDKAIDAGLDWLTKVGGVCHYGRHYEPNEISIREYSFGDVGFYVGNDTPLCWIEIEAIDTKD